VAIQSGRRFFLAAGLVGVLAACGRGTLPPPHSPAASSLAPSPTASRTAIPTNTALAYTPAVPSWTRIPSGTPSLTPALAVDFIPDGARARLGRGFIFDFAASPDGAHLAVGGSTGLFLHSLMPFADLFSIATDTEIYTVAWSPDGAVLATGSVSGIITLWDAATGQPKTHNSDHTYGSLDLEWSPGGEVLAACGSDGGVNLWDTISGTDRIIYPANGEKTPWTSLAWSPDGEMLALGDIAGEITLLDGKSGKETGFFSTGPYGVINSMAWSPDGRMLAYGVDKPVYFVGPDYRVEHIFDVVLLDAAALQIERTLAGSADYLTGVAWSRDGALLAAASEDGNVRIWNPAGSLLHTIHVGKRLTPIAFLPDGKMLAAGARDSILFWNAATAKPEPSLTGYSLAVDSVSWSSGGSSLAAASVSGVVIWDPARPAAPGPFLDAAGTRTAAWSPDGGILATGFEDGMISLRDAISSQLLRTLKGHTGAVTRIAWSPDGTLLASGAQDGKIVFWDARLGKELHTVVLQTQYDWEKLSVSDLSWSPDGSMLAAVLEDFPSANGRIPSPYNGTVAVWDAATGEIKKTLYGDYGWFTRVAWSPDGKTLAAGNVDGSVSLCDPAFGDLTRGWGDGTLWSISSLAWSPDGTMLAIGTESGKLVLWQPDSGGEAVILRGHTRQINSLAYTPDGKTLASGSADGTIILWNT
jgi:WD40 repeat protein